MKKVVLSLSYGALLIGGLLFANNQYEDSATLQPRPTIAPIEIENI
ncbi:MULTISPECIES: hypothetical protein [Clostridia]|nr:MULTISPECIES: hypothetical protein [Clostridia]